MGLPALAIGALTGAVAWAFGASASTIFTAATLGFLVGGYFEFREQVAQESPSQGEFQESVYEISETQIKDANKRTIPVIYGKMKVPLYVIDSVFEPYILRLAPYEDKTLEGSDVFLTKQTGRVFRLLGSFGAGPIHSIERLIIEGQLDYEFEWFKGHEFIEDWTLNSPYPAWHWNFEYEHIGQPLYDTIKQNRREDDGWYGVGQKITIIPSTSEPFEKVRFHIISPPGWGSTSNRGRLYGARATFTVEYQSPSEGIWHEINWVTLNTRWKNAPEEDGQWEMMIEVELPGSDIWNLRFGMADFDVEEYPRFAPHLAGVWYMRKSEDLYFPGVSLIDLKLKYQYGESVSLPNIVGVVIGKEVKNLLVKKEQNIDLWDCEPNDSREAFMVYPIIDKVVSEGNITHIVVDATFPSEKASDPRYSWYQGFNRDFMLNEGEAIEITPWGETPAYNYIKSVTDLGSNQYQIELGVPLGDWTTKDISQMRIKLWYDNPAYVIWDFLTNENFGFGLSESLLDIDSFVEVAKYCNQVVQDPISGDWYYRFRTNIVLDYPRKGSEILKTLCSTFGGYLYWYHGKLHLGVEKGIENFDPDTLTTLTEDAVTNLTLKVKDLSDYPNVIKLQFKDEENDYEDGVVYIEDRTRLEYETYREKDFRLDGVTNKVNAAVLGWQILKAISLSRWAAEFDTSIENAPDMLEVFKLQHSALGTSNNTLIMRVIGLKQTGEGQVRVTAIEFSNEIFDLTDLTFSYNFREKVPRFDTGTPQAVTDYPTWATDVASASSDEETFILRYLFPDKISSNEIKLGFNFQYFGSDPPDLLCIEATASNMEKFRFWEAYHPVVFIDLPLIFGTWKFRILPETEKHNLWYLRLEFSVEIDESWLQLWHVNPFFIDAILHLENLAEDYIEISLEIPDARRWNAPLVSSITAANFFTNEIDVNYSIDNRLNDEGKIYISIFSRKINLNYCRIYFPSFFRFNNLSPTWTTLDDDVFYKYTQNEEEKTHYLELRWKNPQFSIQYQCSLTQGGLLVTQGIWMYEDGNPITQGSVATIHPLSYSNCSQFLGSFLIPSAQDIFSNFQWNTKDWGEDFYLTWAASWVLTLSQGSVIFDLFDTNPSSTTQTLSVFNGSETYTITKNDLNGLISVGSNPLSFALNITAFAQEENVEIYSLNLQFRNLVFTPSLKTVVQVDPSGYDLSSFITTSGYTIFQFETDEGHFLFDLSNKKVYHIDENNELDSGTIKILALWGEK